jgi:nitrogen regulatory protein PII
MHEVKAIIRLERLADVINAIHEIPGLPGVTVSTVQGYGRRKLDDSDSGVVFGEADMAKLEVVVPSDLLSDVLQRIQRLARTGGPGDGKIFVTDVRLAINIRTGEQGRSAI